MQAFTTLLEEATKLIPKEYFQLPVAGREDPLYREGVYCYELYYRIRSLWPTGNRYSLCGEVDKNGHPLIRGDNLNRTKPDFLVHVPGQMDNEIVMEVKPINAKKNQIRKDLRTLTAYRRYAEYRRAILLVYGASEHELDQLKELAKSAARHDGGRTIDLSLIELWHHATSGQAAVSVAW